MSQNPTGAGGLGGKPGSEGGQPMGPQPVVRTPPPSSAPGLGAEPAGPQPVGPQPVSKIQHVPPPGAGAASTKIRAFDQKLMSGRHEDAWQRSPNVTGMGAIHVKSFHCKLTEEALHYLDQQINEWLDAHPQYEVKFVTTSVGEWTGKMKEPNMIVQVWV